MLFKLGLVFDILDQEPLEQLLVLNLAVFLIQAPEQLIEQSILTQLPPQQALLVMPFFQITQLLVETTLYTRQEQPQVYLVDLFLQQIYLEQIRAM